MKVVCRQCEEVCRFESAAGASSLGLTLMIPIHLGAGGVARAVERARQHEQQIGQAVEVLQQLGAQQRGRLLLAGLRHFAGHRHHRPLGAARHGAAHMRLRGRLRAAGQNELGQRRQFGVVVFQRVIKRGHLLGFEQRHAGHRKLAAEIEQIVLHLREQGVDGRRQPHAAQQPEMRIQLIDLAQRLNARGRFQTARAVPQPGGARVASAGGYGGEAQPHDQAASAEAAGAEEAEEAEEAALGPMRRVCSASSDRMFSAAFALRSSGENRASSE